MTPHTREFKSLGVACLDKEGNARTCNYWYVVQEACGPHTAFRTRAALMAWLQRLGLTLAGDLPEHGTHGWLRINGTYRRALHMDRSFSELPGEPVRVLENADYRYGKITTDDHGIRTVHVLNCNVPQRVYPYRESQDIQDAGGAAL